jgi:hypothetical protein
MKGYLGVILGNDPDILYVKRIRKDRLTRNVVTYVLSYTSVQVLVVFFTQRPREDIGISEYRAKVFLDSRPPHQLLRHKTLDKVANAIEVRRTRLPVPLDLLVSLASRLAQRRIDI